MGNKVRLRIAAAVLALAVPVVASGCSSALAGSSQAGSTQPGSTAQSQSRPHGQSQGRPQGQAMTGGALTVKITPAANAARLPVTTEIGVAATGGKVTSVTLLDAAGRRLGGQMRTDASSWVPASELQYGQHYTAKVVATGPTGKTQTSTTSFTTMPDPGSKRVNTRTNLAGGVTYGVGMPIVVDFGTAIPNKDKAAVERRLFVTSSPAQVGAWRWYSDREVMYRPMTYWQPGTQLRVRTALGGLPVGNRYLDQDRTASVVIGPDLEFHVSDTQKSLTVVSNGKTINTYPVSLGKPSTPSWSGNFVIMERKSATIFDTLDQPGGYRELVHYAERLTWSGTFIHSAPWSVAAQGHRDVSHGCVNVGPANAAWIFQNSHIGDPVSITGTPVHVAAGNGWTVWDMSWADYVKGTLQVPVATPLVGSG